MKCPKCGFTSFDYLDSCRQCNADLSETKQKLGLGLLPASVPETLLGATAETASLSEESDFTFQEPEGETSDGLVFSDSDLFEESDLGFSTEQLELGVGETTSPSFEEGQSGSGDLGPIDFDFEEAGLGEPFAAESAPLGTAPAAGPDSVRQQGLSDTDFDEFELSDEDPAKLSDISETSLPDSTLPPPGEETAFSLDMEDFLPEASELDDSDLELTSIDEEDLSFDDLDEFELLDENESNDAATDSEPPAQKAETAAENPDDWKLEDTLDLSDDELLDAIPDLDTDDEK